MDFFKENKKNKIILLLFAVVFASGFFSVRNVSAKTYCICAEFDVNGEQISNDPITFDEDGDCTALCKKRDSKYGLGYNTDAQSEGELEDKAIAVDKAIEKSKSSSLNPLEWVFKKLFAAILVFVGWLVLIAVVILKWILDPETFALFFSNGAINDIWVMTRDFLNIGFILVLLFSAFCTIFQIDKYHIKSVIFKLILMALLVNFSFPIARFVIDVSNVTMYWLLNNIFEGLNDGAGLFASISGESGITGILLPGDAMGYEFQYILAAISFSFIFGITLLIIAVMFVIRLLALGVLVMFSPIGFAGAAFPMASQYASKWWNALFKYSFFAPIMVFMLAVALKLMSAAGDKSREAMRAAAASQTVGGSDMANFIAQGAFFTIPVIVLWIGMGMAQTLSIAGASAVTGKGKQFANWAGKKNWGGIKPLARSTGIPGGVKQRWDNWGKKGKLFGSEAVQRRSDKWAGAIGGYKPGSGGFGFAGAKSGWDKARVEHERKSVNETRKNWKDQGGADENDLHKALVGNDSIKAKAAALELAEKHKFNNLDEFKKAKEMVDNDPVLKNVFNDKVKEKHVKFIIEEHIENAKEKLTKAGKVAGVDYQEEDVKQAIYNKHLSGMNMENLAKQKGLHNNIRRDTHLQEYVRNNISNKPQQHQQLFRNLSSADQRAYASAGFGRPSINNNNGPGGNQGQNHNQNYAHFTNPNYQGNP